MGCVFQLFFFPLERAEEVEECPRLLWELLEAVAMLGPAWTLGLYWFFVIPLSVCDKLCVSLSGCSSVVGSDAVFAVHVPYPLAIMPPSLLRPPPLCGEVTVQGDLYFVKTGPAPFAHGPWICGPCI